MNARVVAIILVLAAVLGGGSIIYYQQERSRPASNVGSLGQLLFKDLQASQVAAIRITEPAGTRTVEQKDGRWSIAERGGFPADFNKVRELVLKGVGLKAAQSEPIGEKDRARLGLDDKALRLEFRAADGKPLGALLVGRKYFKREVEQPDKALGDGRFVMLPGDPKTVFIVSDPLFQATTKTAEWIDRTAFVVEKVKTMEVRYPDGESWKVERSRDDANWKLTPLKGGEKLEVTRANAATYTLSLLDLADVAPKDAKPADTGLDKPIRIDATTLDGLSYAIRIGKLQGDNHFVTFAPSGKLAAPKKDNKEDAERVKKIEDRLPREKQLSEHVLLIGKSKLEDTLKRRVDLREKRDDRKKK